MYRNDRNGRYDSHRNGGRRNVQDIDQADEFWSGRSVKRAQIFEYGVKKVWEVSPAYPDSESDEEGGLHRSKEGQAKDAETVKSSKKKKKRHRKSDSESDVSSSNESRERKKSKKMKKHSKKKKHKKKDSKKKSHKKRHRSSSSDDDSDDEPVWEEKKTEITKTLPKEVKKLKKKKSSDDSDNSDDDFVKPAAVDDEEKIIGPTLEAMDGSSSKPINFGHALLPGEGAAMAAYVQDGKRIPRRGEIGLTSDEITSFEDQGFVMSGSRHRRMEAVRLRKENQIYSADEKAALASFNKIERDKREARILINFKELVSSKTGKD